MIEISPKTQFFRIRQLHRHHSPSWNHVRTRTRAEAGMFQKHATDRHLLRRSSC